MSLQCKNRLHYPIDVIFNNLTQVGLTDVLRLEYDISLIILIISEGCVRFMGPYVGSKTKLLKVAGDFQGSSNSA